MKYKKLLLTGILVGMTVFSLTACDNTEETAPATEETTPATEETAPATEQLPPAVDPSTTDGEGLPPGDNIVPPAPGVGIPPSTDNNTMPGPPQGGMPGERPGVPEIDLAGVAEQLGVTEEQLSEALDNMRDLAAAAEELGVSEESLREAIGIPEGRFPEGGPPEGEPPADGPFPGEPVQVE